MFKNEAYNKSIIIKQQALAFVGQLHSPSNRSLLITQTQEVQLEQLGNGVAYCLILHHYFPSHINVKKVCMCPRRQFDNIHNLRLLSQALASFKSTYISFDVHIPHMQISKVANYFYHDNMLLLNKLYQLISKHSQPTFNPTSQQTHNKQLQFSQTCQIQAKISTMGGLTGKQTPLLCMKPMSTQEKYQLNFHSTSLNNSRSTTPVKSNMKVQSNVVETIKSIVKQNNKSDREKVKELKNLLGI